MSPEVRRQIIHWIVQATLGLVVYSLVLFLSAGRLDWVWGWVLLIVWAIFMAAHPLILIPNRPELLAERQRGVRDPRVKSWDRWIVPLAAGLLPGASWVISGLDFRFDWTRYFPLLYHLVGLVIILVGYGLFLWALASNAFFSEGVRIQEERGHIVVTGGPYRYLRHPGYLGAMLTVLATPILLGSLWALIPGGLSVMLYVVRTYLEDKTLREELPGYQSYAQQTRYRLLPGIW